MYNDGGINGFVTWDGPSSWATPLVASEPSSTADAEAAVATLTEEAKAAASAAGPYQQVLAVSYYDTRPIELVSIDPVSGNSTVVSSAGVGAGASIERRPGRARFETGAGAVEPGCRSLFAHTRRPSPMFPVVVSSPVLLPISLFLTNQPASTSTSSPTHTSSNEFLHCSWRRCLTSSTGPIRAQW